MSMFGRRRYPTKPPALVSALERRLDLCDEFDLVEIIDQLARWAASLPWVVDVPGPAGDESGWSFVVACPPLDCHAVWLSIGGFEDVDWAYGVRVVLPAVVARRGVGAGWAMPVAELDDGRHVVSVALPTTPAELGALECLLCFAYSGAFRTSGAQSHS